MLTKMLINMKLSKKKFFIKLELDQIYIFFLNVSLCNVCKKAIKIIIFYQGSMFCKQK